jgi:hypothetical protein
MADRSRASASKLGAAARWHHRTNHFRNWMRQTPRGEDLHGYCHSLLSQDLRIAGRSQQDLVLCPSIVWAVGPVALCRSVEFDLVPDQVLVEVVLWVPGADPVPPLAVAMCYPET